MCVCVCLHGKSSVKSKIWCACVSHSVLFNSLQPTKAPLFMEFSRQKYCMGSHPILQGIFLTQELNPGIPHCRQILYH